MGWYRTVGWQAAASGFPQPALTESLDHTALTRVENSEIAAPQPHVRFTPQKRTLELSREMSTLCQKQTA